MKDKHTELNAIIDDTIKDFNSATQWRKFLNTAAWNYKYNFLNQVLIYNQRPYAKALATMKWWNEFGRWINKGSKSIICFDKNTHKTIRVFDITDTHKYREDSNIKYWKHNENLTAETVKKLKETYNNLNTDSFEDVVMLLTLRITNNLGYSMDELLVNSAYYTVMTRCGIDASKIIKDEQFSAIQDIPKTKDFITFGNKMQEIAFECLEVIRNTEKIIKLERGKTNEHTEIGNSVRTDTGGILRTEHLHSTATRRGHRQMGTNEGSVVGGERPGRIGDVENIVQTQTAPNGHQRASERTNQGVSQTNGESERNGRKNEDGKSDEVGRSDEQLPFSSRGDSDKRNNLLLDNNGQLNFFKNEAEVDDTSAFSISQDIIEDALVMGSGFANGKMRIYRQFQGSFSAKENAEFLKNEYGIGGSSLSKNNSIYISYDAKGIKISDRNTEIELLLKWTEVEKRISGLIGAEKYLNEKEKAHFAKWLEEQNAKSNEVKQPYNDYLAVKGENPDSIVLYQMGDFFEAYNDDAKTVAEVLDLVMTSRPISDNDRVPMVGFPNHTLEKYTTMLTDKGYDVAVASLENGECKVNNLISKKATEIDSISDEDIVGKELTIDGHTFVIERVGKISGDVSMRDVTLNSFPISRVEKLEYVRNLLNEQDNKVVTESIPLPNIKCEWSESAEFEDGRIYSVAEFDRIMKKADTERVESYNAAIKKYGNSDNVFESDDEEAISGMGYDKTKFTVNLTDGSSFTLRQDIGDGDGGVIDFLKQIPQFEYCIPELEAAVGIKQEVVVDEKTSDFNYKNNLSEQSSIGKKERYKLNIEAIKTLKKCEAENRLATPNEQKILAQYVGWGGLSEAFDENNNSWSKEYKELKDILSPDEYENAIESTLTAFYTPPEIIEAMYKALGNMNFEGGNVLEPSCGIGNFIGGMPDNIKSHSKIYGVELDSVSGKISKHLYQSADITIDGFENTSMPDSFFDVVIGNVPFGDIKLNDRRYNKHHFLIHDYFFAKALDKVRPGGIVAFVTSKGTLDKKNSYVRKYIAQRADLVGAVRLPQNVFKGRAGTEVTSDIIFLQKREIPSLEEPDWVFLDTDENGITMNKYFVDNPQMICGNMEMQSNRFGTSAECVCDEEDFKQKLDAAISNVKATISEKSVSHTVSNGKEIPANPEVRNFSFTVVDDKIYYREDSIMKPMQMTKLGSERVKGLIELRDLVRDLLDSQLEVCSDDEIHEKQQKLDELYTKFTDKYGLISSRANASVFDLDSSYYLLSSLEEVDDDGKLIKKADIFTKRTIAPATVVTSVDTAQEALIVSMAEKAKVDLTFMSSLMNNKPQADIEAELGPLVFRDVDLHKHSFINFDINNYPLVTADEYLSGNVREKLNIVKSIVSLKPETAELFQKNIDMLEKVQPIDLKPTEISVRLGATWIPVEYIEQFVYEKFKVPVYLQSHIGVKYNSLTGEWRVEGKSVDRGLNANKIYGTDRISGYRIVEDTLNLKTVKVYDYFEDANGKKKQVVNQKETQLAQIKQQSIKDEFENWIWENPERREKLCALYNEKYNSIRPREYDGSHLTFHGMNTEIQLQQHQLNAVARVLYGGNTLLAHTVGAGKTFEMIASAQESKRLGLCNKSLFVVPNHLTEQWASEYLKLYPTANILVAKSKDMTPQKRKQFCGRIATGDYDAVIIGHSQFEKIPMSIEYQQIALRKQIDEIVDGIVKLQYDRGERLTIKQLEKKKKNLETRLEMLNDQSRKDDVVTFEQLGVDRLFVDEAHNFKNLYVYSKMTNVAGISNAESQKSSDLYMKCQYLDEITDNKGIIFATGTPVSNSMTEMYTMQRYLQSSTLKNLGFSLFDSWASTFGETVNSIELAPEGKGYRSKTRFSKFTNLPELISTFKEVADVQTADMLKLPVPKANYHTVTVPASELQKQMVDSLAERAEKIRNGNVSNDVDNMLNITQDGRKLALDVRLINEDLPCDKNGKVYVCADNVHKIWEETKEEKLTQIVFCDLSTPHGDGKFSVYNEIKNHLIEKGIPENEIAFIHDANNEAKKKEMFNRVNEGKIRVIIGSTFKLGVGTNIQEKLIALHDLDVPWRPADLEQRAGRIVRRGNTNPEVDIYRYVTQGTFDAYSFQLLENKQKFVSQIFTSKTPLRSISDVDEATLSYAEVKALATGNPLIKEKFELDSEVAKLKVLKQSYKNNKYDLENKIAKYFPQEIQCYTELIKRCEKDLQLKNQIFGDGTEFLGMNILGKHFSEKSDAGKAILKCFQAIKPTEENVIGEYCGFKMLLSFDSLKQEFLLKLKGDLSHTVHLGQDENGNITRIDNVLKSIDKRLENFKMQLNNINAEFEIAQKEVQKPFEREVEYNEKLSRLNELNATLNIENNRVEKNTEIENNCR